MRKFGFLPTRIHVHVFEYIRFYFIYFINEEKKKKIFIRPLILF
jgi:hypothetical protein